MRKFLEQRGSAFDPEAIAVIVRAFDIAWSTLEQTLEPGSDQNARAVMRDKLASCMVDTAAEGETDPKRLAEYCLLRFTREHSSG